MHERLKPGPWEISFVGNMSPGSMGVKPGYYVSRMVPGSKAPNAREWMQRGSVPRRFASVEDAQIAIAKEVHE